MTYAPLKISNSSFNSLSGDEVPEIVLLEIEAGKIKYAQTMRFVIEEKKRNIIFCFSCDPQMHLHMHYPFTSNSG